NVWQQYELRVKRLDIRFAERLTELHSQARSAGKWKGTPAADNHVDYWVEGVLAYFDASARDGVGHTIRTRESLTDYDPGLHALVNETFAYEGKPDWRFSR